MNYDQRLANFSAYQPTLPIIALNPANTPISHSVYNYIEPKHNYDCQKLINGDRAEAQRVRSMHQNDVFTIPDIAYTQLASNCTDFVSKRGYITDFVSETELDFPLAFSILMYKDVEQFERLLRAIYRPHNFYCVHVDLKSSDDVKRAVSDVTSCFHNVFVLDKSVDVQWAHFSVVQPDLMCMRELLKHRKWK